MRNKMIFLCVIAFILTVLPLTAMAQQLDYNQKGSITVKLESPDPRKSMEGAELFVYYVATVGVNNRGNLTYRYTDAFKECGFSLDDPKLVTKLDNYVSTNTVSFQKIVTDFQGKASCSDLALGLYFIKQTGAVEGFSLCQPFLARVPVKTFDGYQYQVNAFPKTGIVKLTDITIKKVWNTGSSSGIPSSVTVQLLRDEKVVETATLNKQNDWQITYKDMPESDLYSIKEENVPKGYTATYSTKGNVFTVTNTPTLAQTGQLVWPIPVFALAGIFFLVTGFVILRKPGKQDA